MKLALPPAIAAHPTVQLLRHHPGLWLLPMVLAASLVLDPVGVQHGPTLCVSRLGFGIPCAGCGLTRASVALGHGLWQQAIDFNVLSPLWWLWGALWWTASIVRIARGQPVQPTPRWATLLALTLLVTFWVVRLVAFFRQPDWDAQMAHDSLILRAYLTLRG